MSSDWNLLHCPHCSQQFKAPTSLEIGDEIACPACGGEVGERSRPKPKDPSATRLPPQQKQDLDMEMPELVIKDGNPLSQPQHSDDHAFEEEHKPALIGKLGSTADIEPIDADGEAARERILSRRERQAMVGWDDEEGSDEDEALPKPSFASSLKFILVALPIVLLGVFLALKARPRSRNVPEPLPAERPVDPMKDLYADEKPSSVTTMVRKMGAKAFYEFSKGTIQGFLEAPDLATRLKYCRNPERVRPLMERYYKTHDPGPIPYHQLPKDEGGVVSGVNINFVIGAKFEERPIAILRSVQNPEDLVVDWESFVGYNEMDFDQLAVKKPTEPVTLRVVAQPDDYYNFGIFEEKYWCMRLSNIERTKAVYGYIEKGSKLADRFEAEGIKAQSYMMLQLRYPDPPAGPNQVLIHDVKQFGWIVFDE